MTHLRFGLMSLLLLGGLWRFAHGGFSICLPVLAVPALVLVLDALGAEERTVPSALLPWALNGWLFLTLPLILLQHAVLWWLAGTEDPAGLGAWVFRLLGQDLAAARAATRPWHWPGALAGCALLTAAAATTVGHELVHRTLKPLHMVWGRWLLAFTFDTGFAIEHVHGHHARVSTLEDPASARRGENVYGFLLRSTWGQLRSAWELECRRLQRRGLARFTWRNRFLRGWPMSAALAVLAWVIGGPRALLFFVLSGILGKAVLEAINFVEHYGLVRLPGSRVEPRHSWNSNAWLSSTVLYNLTRHSDHHAEGGKPYWRLQPLPEAPMLPFGYMAMLLLALVPPLFRRLMVPRLRDWDASHASPEECALAEAETRRSGWTELLRG